VKYDRKVRPERECVYLRVRDVIRSIKPHETAQNGPITKGACGETGDFGAIWAFIELMNEFAIEICVESVVPGKSGILKRSVCCWRARFGKGRTMRSAQGRSPWFGGSQDDMLSI